MQKTMKNDWNPGIWVLIWEYSVGAFKWIPTWQGRDAKNMENDWNPGIWVLIWEYSAGAFKWIPTWQGLDGFQKSLQPCALDESSLIISHFSAAVVIEMCSSSRYPTCPVNLLMLLISPPLLPLSRRTNSFGIQFLNLHPFNPLNQSLPCQPFKPLNCTPW